MGADRVVVCGVDSSADDWVAVVGGGEAPQRFTGEAATLPASGLPPHDEVLVRERLQRLDAACRLWPGVVPSTSSDAISGHMASRSHWLHPGEAPSLSPSAYDLLQRIVTDLSPESVVIERDPDGLSLVLAEQVRTLVWAPNRLHRRWLQQRAEAQREAPEVCSSPPDEPAALCVVWYAGDWAALRASAERLLPGGHLLAITSGCRYEGLRAMAARVGLRPVRSVSMCLPSVLPGCFAGFTHDLLLLQRGSAGGEEVVPALGLIELSAVSPGPGREDSRNALLDTFLDTLLDTLLDTVAALGPGEAVLRDVHGDAGRTHAWMVFDTGATLSVVLHHESNDLLAMVECGSSVVEMAFVVGAFLTMAGPHTRLQRVSDGGHLPWKIASG